MIGLYDWIDDDDIDILFVHRVINTFLRWKMLRKRSKRIMPIINKNPSAASCVHLVNFKWRIPQVLNSKVEKVTAEATNFANQQLYCYELMIAIYA